MQHENVGYYRAVARAAPGRRASTDSRSNFAYFVGRFSGWPRWYLREERTVRTADDDLENQKRSQLVNQGQTESLKTSRDCIRHYALLLKGYMNWNIVLERKGEFVAYSGPFVVFLSEVKL